MFRSNFNVIFGTRHHKNRLAVGNAEKRVRMTLFCTRNIPTMFGVHFLSFPISTTENCFGRILTTIPSTNNNGAGPELANLKTVTGRIGFCTRNIPILFGMQFLAFLVYTPEKNFSRILATFSRLESSRLGKVENRAHMTQFCTRNIPTIFGVWFLLALVDN